MDMLKKLEITRTILNNAGKMNVSKELLLKISQQMDKYIMDYYRKQPPKK